MRSISIRCIKENCQSSFHADFRSTLVGKVFSKQRLKFQAHFYSKLLHGFRRIELQWQVKWTTTMYFLKLEKLFKRYFSSHKRNTVVHEWMMHLYIYCCTPKALYNHVGVSTWDDIKVSKWLHNFNFWVNSTFKLLLSNASLYALQEIHICWFAPWDNNQATPCRSSKLYWVCNLLSNVDFPPFSSPFCFHGSVFHV